MHNKIRKKYAKKTMIKNYKKVVNKQKIVLQLAALFYIMTWFLK